jgi:uncharacterized membrane protein
MAHNSTMHHAASDALHEHLRARGEHIRSLKAQADAKRTRKEKFADWLVEHSGTMTFLLLNVGWVALWLAINVGIVPISAFDPFPFGLLTLILSIEAIVLSIAVLISQNRASQIADLRSEIDLHVDILSEKELTKLLYMMRLLLEKNGVDLADDKEFQSMLEPTNVSHIEHILERQMIHNRRKR